MLIQTLIPVGLILIMFSIGLGLEKTDFARLLDRPKAAITILLVQLLVLPSAAIGIALALNLSDPLFLGLVLVAACPGGITSNMLCRLAHGDVALSIGLTVATSFLSVLSIPLVFEVLSLFLGRQDTNLTLSFFDIVTQITVLTIIPLSIGMLFRAKLPIKSIQFEPMVVKVSSIFFLLLILTTWIDQWKNIVSSVAAAGLAVTLLLTINIALGTGIAKLIKLNSKEITTMAIEVGIQNSAMAFMIAASILNNMTVAIPSALYSVLMIIAGLSIVGLRQKIERQPDSILTR